MAPKSKICVKINHLESYMQPAELCSRRRHNPRRELIDAAFALNEGGGGELDSGGHRVSLDVEAGEKFLQNYRLEVTNPGGTALGR
jgi:hypothetical protein